MNMNEMRQDYRKFQFSEGDLPANPFELFDAWFHHAHSSGEPEANAMVVSTVGADGAPNGRVVLLKEVDNGFVWFTNYHSTKGKELEINPLASLTFWWPASERQVRIKGTVEKTSERESDLYFNSRPRSSQVGAIASAQSSIIEGREALDNTYQSLLNLPENEPLKRPIHWGGYRLIPNWFEFWQGRSSRLHDRFFYQQAAGGWKTGRLSP